MDSRIFAEPIPIVEFIRRAGVSWGGKAAGCWNGRSVSGSAKPNAYRYSFDLQLLPKRSEHSISGVYEPVPRMVLG